MYSLFYDPETLTIKGMSDGDLSMDFPYVTLDEGYFSIEHLTLVRDEDGTVRAELTHGTL